MADKDAAPAADEDVVRVLQEQLEAMKIELAEARAEVRRCAGLLMVLFFIFFKAFVPHVCFRRWRGMKRGTNKRC